MRKVVTRLRFLSHEDQGLYTPLIPGASSGAYSTMSRTAAAAMGHPSPELVHPVDSSVGKDDDATTDVPVFSPRISDEPIVTRKELWSYYRMYRSSSIMTFTVTWLSWAHGLTACNQYITMEIMCVDSFVYY
jgi:hypothetical protein